MTASAPPSPARRTGRTRTALVAVITVLLVAAALKLSKPVTLPAVAGFFLVVLAWPIRTWLRQRAPGWVATLGAFFVILLVFLAFVVAIAWMVQLVAEAVPRYQGVIEETVASVRGWLESRGLPVPGGGSAAGRLGGSAGGGGSSFATRVAMDLFATGGILLLMFAFFGLGLAEVADFRRKADEALARRQYRRLSDTLGEIARQWRIYVLAKTATSLLTGAVTALFCLLVGLDLWMVWGFVAFLLEYVPTIGSTIAVVPPALFAIVQFGLGAKALMVAGGVALLQIVMGNFVDPRIEGRFLTLSPVGVLFAIVFWGWLWGALGALLGVPLTAAVLIGCRHFEGTRWIAEMLTEGE